MKDKESNQNYKVPILVLIGVVIAVLIVCYLVIDILIDFKNAKEVLPIIISIFGLFATFGGAYLGAKISGDKAREQSQVELNAKIEYDFYLKNYDMIKILEEKVNPILNKLSNDYVKYKDNDCFSNMFISNLREKNCDLFREATNTIDVTENKFYEIKLNDIIEISQEIKIILNDISESLEIKKAFEEYNKTRSKSSEKKLEKSVYQPTRYTLGRMNKIINIYNELKITKVEDIKIDHRLIF